MSLHTEINESIKKNLPQQVGENLKKELARLARLEDDNIALKESVKVKNERIKDLEKRQLELNEELTQYEAMEQREHEVEQAEMKLNTDRLEYQLKAEKEKTEHAMAVAMGLVRNTEYRKSMSGHETVMETYSDGATYAKSQPVDGQTTEGAA
jgi:vacuolar-type H+-ATPase subunit I/STV1